MRLKLILPVVEPETYAEPQGCPREGCGGKHFLVFQEVKKNTRDSVHEEVKARRCKCLRCGHTFRIYPQGVNKGQVSLRVKGMAVMLYLLGLSYGAVVIMLEALGIYLSKASVYRCVQAAGEAVPGLKRRQLLPGYQTKALGADLTGVKCKGEWLTLGVTVDPLNGWVLSIDELSAEDAHTLQAWIEPIAESVGARTLVTDDADALKTAADESGLYQQVCKSHVSRNTEELIANLSQAIQAGRDTSLADIHIENTQALADLRRLGELIHSRQPEQQAELCTLYERYAQATAPAKGASASIAYRLRNLFLDRWNLWPHLTFYRTWKDAAGLPILDGTNNATERAIGWWIKERYRTMRGYKRLQSALNVSRLIAHCGNHLASGLDLTPMLAGC
jgi:transposase-like protein